MGFRRSVTSLNTILVMCLRKYASFWQKGPIVLDSPDSVLTRKMLGTTLIGLFFSNDGYISLPLGGIANTTNILYYICRFYSG